MGQHVLVYSRLPVTEGYTITVVTPPPSLYTALYGVASDVRTSRFEGRYKNPIIYAIYGMEAQICNYSFCPRGIALLIGAVDPPHYVS